MNWRPPRTIEFLLRLVVPDDVRKDVLGDLQETCVRRAAMGERVRFWYWRQAIGLAFGYLAERLSLRPMWAGVGADIRLALRVLLRRPAMTTLVVLTLGLGIGANTAIFGFIHAILLRPLPFRDPHRLVQIDSMHGGQPGLISIAEVNEMREHLTDLFEDVAAFRGGFAFNISGDDRPEEIPATLCTSNLFEVLGVPLAHGAAWPREFDRLRGDAVLLHHGFWQRRFGGNPGVTGRKITLDADPRYQIHGVVAPSVDFPFRADVYRSLVLRPGQVTDRKFRGVLALARLRPNATYGQARTALERMALRLANDYPESNAGHTLRLTPIRDVYAGEVRPYLWLLAAAVTLVLLIACSNVVNVLLVRATATTAETAIRAALGAGKARLLRQHLVESIVLALLGGLFGVAMSIWSVRLLSATLQNKLPAWITVDIDSSVLGFALLLTCACGIAAGVAPAWHAVRADLATRMRNGSRGSAGRQTTRLRALLVAGQVALATTLLVGAGLVVRSFARLQQADLGFDPRSVLTFKVSLSYAKYSPEGPETEAFYRQLVERIETLPGVEAVALNHNLPLTKPDDADVTPIAAEGQSIDEIRRNPYVALQRVSPQYFLVMGIPLLQGRAFDTGDRRESSRVALLSERLARLLWPGENPIGRRMRIMPRTVWDIKDGSESWLTVVGVAKSVRHEELTEREGGFALYVPVAQMMNYNQYVLVKTRVPPKELTGAVTRAVWARRSAAIQLGHFHYGRTRGITDVAPANRAHTLSLVLRPGGDPVGDRNLWRAVRSGHQPHAGDRNPNGSRRNTSGYYRRRSRPCLAADCQRSRCWPRCKLAPHSSDAGAPLRSQRHGSSCLPDGAAAALSDRTGGNAGSGVASIARRSHDGFAP